MIVIDPTARISRLADIEDSVRGTRIEIGPRVVINSFVKIKPAGGMGNLSIGEGSYINSGTVIYTGNGVQIGSGVLIAANCTFAAANHEYSAASVPIARQGFRPSRGGILVEDDVWIGANCVLLDGAVVRKGAVVGAGSVIRGELAPYTVYAGNPPTEIAKRS